jgi:UDP-galactopyranose mutase
MNTTADYLIIGSGLTGSVIARMLSDAGREVLVLERRSHMGGNVHDFTHSSGISIHTYGPHYFRTSSEEIWGFVNRFSAFSKYEAVLKTYVDGMHENWPITSSYIKRKVGQEWRPDFTDTPSNFEDASLAMMPRFVYEKFVKGYTEKQWGVPARSLGAELAKRFDVREGDDFRLVRHKYQGIPVNGYSGLMNGMLCGIPVLLNIDYLKAPDCFSARKLLIFTGPIDEFFGYDLGRLVYRGQLRNHTYFPDAEYVQPCGQVNNPDPANGSHIRTLEWKYMMPSEYATRIRGTVLTVETPFSPCDSDRYEYPFPDNANIRIFKKYKKRAEAMPNTMICGRLGEYRYYDMDQAIERAMVLAGQILAC